MSENTKTQWKIAIFSAGVAVFVAILPYIIDFAINNSRPKVATCSETFNMSTAWTGGGGHDAYCPTLGQQAIESRGLGEKGVSLTTSPAGEEAKWGNATLRTNRQYRYTCKIELQWRTSLTDDVNPDICTAEAPAPTKWSFINLIYALVAFIIVLIGGVFWRKRKAA